MFFQISCHQDLQFCFVNKCAGHIYYIILGSTVELRQSGITSAPTVNIEKKNQLLSEQ